LSVVKKWFSLVEYC